MQKSGDDKSSLFNEPFDDSCVSIKACKSIKRIKAILHYHQFIANDNQTNLNEIEQELLEYMTNHKYSNLINDYHHIMLNHLNLSKPEDNAKNYEFLNSTISKLIPCHSISKCGAYMRNNRNRETTNNNNSVSVYCTDIIDNLHSFLIHGYQTGYRMKMNINNEQKEDQLNHNTDDINDDSLFKDKIMSNLQNDLKEKRAKLVAVRGDERMKHSKFTTEIPSTQIKNDTKTCLDELYQYLLTNKKNTSFPLSQLNQFIISNEYDSDTIFYDINNNNKQNSNINKYIICNDNKNWSTFLEAVNLLLKTDETKETKNELEKEYSFGHRYYYWAWFKNNTETDIFNPGYKYKDWYIVRKHKSLKDEIIPFINVNEFESVLNKAKQLIAHSNAIKKLVSRWTVSIGRDGINYGIEPGEAISYENIVSVILYTDYTKLSYEFSCTWRKKHDTETNEELKKRNAEFWKWSRLLMETVHVFGERLNYDSQRSDHLEKIPVLYHGVTYLYFSSFITRFCSPTSMTRQLSVATIFSGTNGLILEIEQYKSLYTCPYYFNCTLLSSFVSEDERLFIGGAGYNDLYSNTPMDGGYLQLRTIRLIKENANYLWLIRCLQLLNIVIKADYLTHELEQKLQKPITWYLRVTNLLIDDYHKPKTKNKFPFYVRKCFEKFMNNKQTFIINVWTIDKSYPQFRSLFKFSTKEDCADLLLFDNVCSKFSKCKEIALEMNMNGENEITKNFVDELIRILLNVNMDNKASLEIIQLVHFYFRGTDIDYISSALSKHKCGWSIEQRNYIYKPTNFVSLYIYRQKY